MLFSLSGTEFAVNTSAAGTQRYSDIAALKGAGGAADGFVAVWEDGDNAIRGQRLTASGTPAGGEFLVNMLDDAPRQGKPAVAALDGGGFVVVWNNILSGIVAQRFDAAGGKVGEDLRITASDKPYQDKPAVTAVAGGGFAVAWEGKTSQTGVPNIFSQLVGADGVKLGGETVLSASGTGFGAFNGAAAKFGDGYVVAWQDNSAGSEIKVQVFVEGGAKNGDAATVATASGFVSSPTIAALKDGGFVAAWTSSDAPNTYAVTAQVFGSDGKPLGDKVVVAAADTDFASLPDIAALPDGGFAVSWQVRDYEASDTDVFARSFGANGTAAGGAFKLNTATAGEQTYAEIAAGVDGKLAVVWTGQTGGDIDIKGQAFDSDFNPLPVESLALAGDLAATVPFKSAYTLTVADLGTLYADGNVSYTVSGAKNGFVSLTSNITPVKTFTQADLNAGKVVFVQSGKAATSGSFDVSARDADETTAARTFTVAVTNKAPTAITYFNPYSDGTTDLPYFEEDRSIAWNLRVNDPEGESATNGIAWSIVGGVDKGAFTIGKSGILGGSLRLKNPEDYENPTDANKDHKFDVVVRATDSLGAFVEKQLTVRVENLGEISLSEGAARGTVAVKGNTLVDFSDTGFDFGDFKGSVSEYVKAAVQAFVGGIFSYGRVVDGGKFVSDKAGNILVKDGFDLDYEQAPNVYIDVVTGGDLFTPSYRPTFLVKLKDVKDEYVSGNDKDNKLVGGSGNDTFFGKGGGDILDAGNGRNRLDGGTGDDGLVGGRNDDTFVVDSLKDTVSEQFGGGEDTVEASLSYSLSDQANKEKITGFLENLTLLDDRDAKQATGNDLKNELTGNRYGNTLDGGKRADTMRGLGGDDTYKVDDKGDRVDESVKGSSGRDTVVSTVSFDLTDKAQARGDIETIVLDGGRKAIDAEGNDLANLITGNEGDNKITGNGGADKLIGGLAGNSNHGADTFIFKAVSDSGATAATRDQIFTFAEGDHIDLSRINPEGRKTFALDKGGAFESGEIRQTLNKDKTLLLEINTDKDNAPEMTILLHSMTAKLDAGDFFF